MTSAQARSLASLTDSEQRWLRVQDYLGAHRFELGRDAVSAYPDADTIGPTPLLTSPLRVPLAPIPVEDVALELDPAERSAGARHLTERAALAVLPDRADGSRFESYSAAIAELTGRTFDNRQTYRLLNADLSSGTPGLRFGLGSYFDGLDSGEACAHEFAAGRLGLLEPDEQQIRRAVGDPCDPKRRPTNLAISTLTLRRDRDAGGATFLLHWRDPQKVGHAAGLYQVLPTGVFQAADEAPWNLTNDFSLWRSMVREYAEEFLGESEDYGAELAPIDYDAWTFAATMTRGLRDGAVGAYVLGLGVDPLTLATDLLTVLVIDADLYDRLFADAVAINAEGEVLASLDGIPASADGVPFTREVVDRFVQEEPMQAAGAAVLWSAWEHRRILLG
jgi:hypothetical protein